MLTWIKNRYFHYGVQRFVCSCYNPACLFILGCIWQAVSCISYTNIVHRFYNPKNYKFQIFSYFFILLVTLEDCPFFDKHAEVGNEYALQTPNDRCCQGRIVLCAQYPTCHLKPKSRGPSSKT